MEKRGLNSAEMRGYIAIALLLVGLGSLPFLSRLIPAQSEESVVAIEPSAPEIIPFDPNTVDLATLRLAGFSRSQAVSLLRYRATGKIFRIKEEVYAVYGMSDSLYFAIEPYINIGEEYRYSPSPERRNNPAKVETKPKRELLTPTRFRIDTVSARYMVAIGALSPRQAETFIKWRDMSGIADIEALKECYTVSDSVAMALEPYIIFPEATIEQPQEIQEPQLVDLNRADSVALCSVWGIGAKSAAAIIEYRTRLGGYHSVEQLSEVEIITESNYEKIISQISCDSCDISKIDVNFAHPKVLISHPYIGQRALRRLLKTRELKGGWSTTKQMVEDNIFTKEEAARLHPYLSFRVQQFRE